MKFKTLLITCVGATLLASSCIKEEGLDREADILSVSIEDEGFMTALINEDKGIISLVMEGDISKYESGVIVPKITTSPFSTVSPKSQESVQLKDYNKNYVVKAEDGSLKDYKLSIKTFQPLVQGFEDWYTAGSGNKKYDVPGDDMWKTANSGVAQLYRPNEAFPTRKAINEKRPGSEGNTSVILETVKGSDKEALKYIPIYAGNMYTGIFDFSSGLSEPLKTTKFGQPHPKYLGKPLALTAWYKYKSGEKYQTWNDKTKDVGWESVNQIDKCDIYAILFKVTKGESGRNEYLTAENIKDSPLIVARAEMTDQTEKEEWIKLNIKFDYGKNKQLDFENNDYKLAVVLSSSKEGAFFEGAIGSILTVDDLRVVFESDEDADLYK